MTAAGCWRRFKEDPDLRRIPEIILTSFKAERGITAIYNLCGNRCHTRPVDLVPFTGVVRSIEAFWLTALDLPEGGLT